MSHPSIFKKYIAGYLKQDTSKDFEIKISREKGLHFANKIRDAVLANKKIYVYGDYDVDGIGSTTFMTEIIKDLAKFNDRRVKLDYKIPSRAEHYGLKYDFLQKALKSYDLFITVDNGTHKEFFSQLSDADKKKLLIIDHHPNGDFSKEENVINPNIDGSVSISTGIIIDFLHQCFRHIDKSYSRRRDTDYYKDLAAITLISDMANVNNKTIRAYIKKGLERIEQRERPVYSHFFPEWKKSVEVEDVAFNLIPKLNSVGRLGLELDWVVKLMQSKKETEFVKESILILEDTNEQRKEALNYYTGVIEKEIQKSGIDLETAPLLYFHYDEVPIGLNGLIAGNLSQKYKTNAIFTSINYGGDEKALGSGRGDNIKKELTSLIEQYPEVGKTMQFGGHLKAIGLKVENTELLANRIKEYVSKNKKRNYDSGKHLVTSDIKTLSEYKELCLEYGEICGSIPLNDSFYVPVSMLILGFNEYRNDFVKMTCQDKDGVIVDIVTKNSSEFDILSQDFIEIAMEIKTIGEEDKNVIFTDFSNLKSFSKENNATIKEEKEQVVDNPVSVKP